jgi:D-serine deaminase-like pyridoxal phosphate-dependent protein
MSQASALEQLVAASKAQPQPQALLFVFAGAALPANASPAQRASFEAGAGGELTPLMCVAKSPDELSTFDTLVQESRSAGPPWDVLFAAGCGGKDGQPPTPEAVEAALKTMVAGINNGAIESFLALSAEGKQITFA